ncbi:unnamed protein product [Prorocentrum cordatum]|uniref:ABC transporter domain-containing protein n=1 Tax=Prorocentrum cordatum TaxID=2364126 RepID=A0ABN9XRG9_9DINO|nr:unnamed protein product [Polarella glacialis]
METSDTEAAQALKPVLDPFDVDEDTFESLRDMVKEAFGEHGAGGANKLAPQLEELLEPFLLAFGAEPTAVPTAALQVAVSLCGLPEPTAAAKPVAAPDPVAAPAAAQKPAEAERKPAAGGGFTLEAFCAGGSSGSGAKAKAKAFAPAQRGGGGAGGAPKTLSGLWKTEVHAKVKAAWDLGQGAAEGGGDGFVLREDSGGSDEEHDEEGEPQEDGAREKQARERRQRKETSRALRLAAAEARANAAPTEDLATVASLGLSETREGKVEADKKKRPARAPHMRGAGGRNVHLEGINVTLNGPTGSVDLLKEADVHLSAGHVYGLVGKNGCGKTTLLRRLATGAVPGLPPHLRFRYMAQELSCLNPEQTPLEAVVHSDEERRELLEERERLDALLSGAEQAKGAEELAAADARAQRFLEVERCLEAIDADGAEDRAQTMLRVLNFDDATMRRPTGSLSGGWQMRLALAVVLFSRPDVLLLDEPTNHLDLHGVLWLQRHLRCEWGAASAKKDRIVVIVSHDRSFLDACATDILEIHSCKLRNFAGNYSAYLDRVLDEQRLALLKREEEERAEKVAEKELRAMKKKAREHKDDKKVRQLKSKEKQLTERKLKLSSAREFGDGRDDIFAKLREDTSLRFRFPEADNVLDADTNYLEMDGATIRQGDRVILKNVTLTIEPRSRIAIVGANGAGKSTLMKALCGELKADEGPRGRGKIHPAFKPAFVSQNHLERLEGSLRVNCMDHLREQLPDASTLRNTEGMLTKQCDDSLIRATLGNFGMGRDALKKVGYLSGGQRARLSLATATWWEPTALLLDEPTNHLDVDSLDALTLGLQAFDGPVVVVSHSRGFLEALCEELWIVRDGTVHVCTKGEEAFAQFFAQYVKQVEASLK